MKQHSAILFYTRIVVSGGIVVDRLKKDNSVIFSHHTLISLLTAQADIHLGGYLFSIKGHMFLYTSN